MNDELREASIELLLHCARIVRAARQGSSAPVAQMRVLSALDEHGPLRVSTLAAIDNCSQPTMTGTVATLLSGGDVTKAPDPSDARASLVALTPEGRDRLGDLRRQYADVLVARIEAGTGLTPTDLRAAANVLRTILTTPVREDDRA
ncbi:MarR family winged helix-turn-helix transcriptional regulator [Nocardioides daejeonensis]|uniref:MarR family winged helix-turn-helix transcriptional regulator n=1 Tax=Nocardioides daejeonensis TaxID=1046556 RepID=UPI000D747465|nr:MarR family winged helix-turn-helix transcriptional regulator [Nocardioides daejeonensis]